MEQHDRRRRVLDWATEQVGRVAAVLEEEKVLTKPVHQAIIQVLLELVRELDKGD